jgi:hypothetical protein
MQRRTVVKGFLYIGGAAFLLPACMQQDSKPLAAFKKLAITGSEEDLMAELCETIIPATDTPGAKAVGAHLFTLLMVNDCYEKEDQKKFMSGLKAFAARAKKEGDKLFTDCTAGEREAIVKGVDAARSGNAELDYFYATTKKLTLQAYATSAYYLTKVQEYKLVPGHFYGCVPVKQQTVKS